MKVLLIDVNCKSGSTGEIVYNTYAYLVSNSVDSRVCYGRGPVFADENLYKFGIDIETNFHAFLARITGLNGVFSFISTRRLLRFIHKYKPDIIHIHELHAYFVNIFKLLKSIAELDIPVVHTLHCEYSYTGKCGISFSCNRWLKGCGKCPDISRYPASLFFDYSSWMYLKKRDSFNLIKNLVITAPSKWLADRARLSFFQNRRIDVVYNGVNTQFFHECKDPQLRERHNIKQDCIMVVSIAPQIMSNLKGGKEILKVANMLRGENVRFILIGNDGPREEHGNVTIMPAIYDKKMLAKYYSEADFFLLCSSKETFSMTCAEALCCGTQVIGYRCGAPEQIFKYPYASFYNYGDYKAIAKAILSSPRIPKFDVSSYGRREFSSEAMAERYLKIYESLV